MLADNIFSRPSRAALALCVGLALTAGCKKGGGSHGHGNGNGNHNGPIVFFENEPNDSPGFADVIGTVTADSNFFIDGHVQSFPGFDTVDYFEFFVPEPVVIEFIVEGFAHNADLDLCVYDPDLDAIVACFESPLNPEVAEVVVHEYGKVFQILVDAYSVDSEYTIEVFGSPYLVPVASQGIERPAITVAPDALETAAAKRPEAAKEEDAATAVRERT
ncbi:MAG: hypothetical protein GY711_13805 [bacterium]|nr:hypothetical protein [bacterium]